MCCGLLMAWQADGELGERAGFALDRDRAAMLLGDDVVADRQAEPGALAGRLGREERLEQPGPVFRRDADAVVVYPDLDHIAEIARPHLQHRTVSVSGLPAAFARGIKAVADQVYQNPGHVLRHHLDWRKVRVEVALHRDVEALVLGAG